MRSRSTRRAGRGCAWHPYSDVAALRDAVAAEPAKLLSVGGSARDLRGVMRRATVAPDPVPD